MQVQSGAVCVGIGNSYHRYSRCGTLVSFFPPDFSKVNGNVCLFFSNKSLVPTLLGFFSSSGGSGVRGSNPSRYCHAVVGL